MRLALPRSDPLAGLAFCRSSTLLEAVLAIPAEPTQAEVRARAGLDECRIRRLKLNRQKAHPWIAGRLDFGLSGKSDAGRRDMPPGSYYPTRWRGNEPTSERPCGELPSAQCPHPGLIAPAAPWCMLTPRGPAGKCTDSHRLDERTRLVNASNNGVVAGAAS